MLHDQIKNLVLIALATDEELMETLVLKGGNAIYLLEKDKRDFISRTSYDLDFSIENDFDGNLDEIKLRIEGTIKKTFEENGYIAFDYSFNLQPTKVREEVKDFWGGYYIEFKIIPIEKHNKLKDNINELRKYAVPIMPNYSPKIEIEISKYEYVGKKIEADVEGYTIYIYSPQMIVLEKLRAICQQIPEYSNVVPSFSPRPRARDFYDIYTISTQHEIDIESEDSLKTLEAIFSAKKVPLDLMKFIKENSGIHRENWQSVIDTVSAKEDLQDFDFYLDYVLNMVKKITSP